MAQIDLRNATIRLWDGTTPTLTLNSANSLSDVILTSKSRHDGSKRISCTFVNPGTSGVLSVAVTGRDIVVTLAYSSGITSTAALVVAAINNLAAAAALVTATPEGAGSGIVAVQAKQYLSGQKSLTIKIGDGNLSYTEHRKVDFTLDRGIMDTVRLGEDTPMDVTMDFLWDWLASEDGALTPTIEEVLCKEGAASAWVSTANDQCQPYCVDMEVVNDPDCSGVDNEIVTFEEYYKETLDHDLKKGSVSAKGRCNRKQATLARLAI